MSTKAKRHTHKYHRIEIAGNPTWACALSDCNHYMPPHMASMIPGKASFCWECNDGIILDAANMVEDKPRCVSCRSGISPDSIEAIVGNL